MPVFMDETIDLRSWLEKWPYDPERCLRLTHGYDGRELLLVRLPLGIEQYELKGRPDGLKPYGCESVLEHHLDRLAEARARDQAEDFDLGPNECAELFNEGTLYYNRYIHLFQLKDWKRTARDTARNIQLFDLVHQFALNEEDRMNLEQWRPFILRIHSTAEAMMQIEAGHPGSAIQTIKEAVQKIELLDILDNETFLFERQRSLSALNEFLAQISTDLEPSHSSASELRRLELELRRAIEEQAFEQAAQLRDRIQELKKKTEAGQK